MNRKFATYVSCFIMAVFAMNLTMISPLLVEISRTFSLGIAQSGVFFTIEFAGFILFVILGGIYSERWGKKPVVLLSMAGFAASLLLFSLAPGFRSACIIMFFMGGFGGIIESIVTALVSDLNEINRSFYVNLSQVFFGLGALAGPVAAGLAVGGGLGWRSCYQFLGGLSLLLVIVFALCRIPFAPSPDKVTFSDVKRLFSVREFLIICLCMFFYTGSEVGGWGWLSTLLKQSLGFTAAKSGVAVALFWVAMTVGRFLCGPLTLRFSLKRIVTVLAFLSALVTMLSIFELNEAFVWIVIVLMGLSYSSLYPMIAAYGAGKSGVPSGTSFSILVGSGGVGSMVVPYVMGVVGDAAGMRLSMAIPAALLLFVGLLFLRFKQETASGEPSLQPDPN